MRCNITQPLVCAVRLFAPNAIGPFFLFISRCDRPLNRAQCDRPFACLQFGQSNTIGLRSNDHQATQPQQLLTSTITSFGYAIIMNGIGTKPGWIQQSCSLGVVLPRGRSIHPAPHHGTQRRTHSLQPSADALQRCGDARTGLAP